MGHRAARSPGRPASPPLARAPAGWPPVPGFRRSIARRERAIREWPVIASGAGAKSGRLRRRKTGKTGRDGSGFRLAAGTAHRFPGYGHGPAAGQPQTGTCPSGQVRAMPPARPAARAATRAGRPGRDDPAWRSAGTRPVAGYPASGAAFPRAFRGWPAQRDQAAVPVGRPANRPLIPLPTAGDSTGLSADTSRYRGLSRVRNGFRRPVNHTSTARRSRRGRDHARRDLPGRPGGRARPARFRPRSRARPRPRLAGLRPAGPPEPGSYLHCFQCVE
jgi:hypothetical protein